MEFSEKKKSLFKTLDNQFVKEGLQLSPEGAKKYNTSNNVFVDNFALIANFKEPRNYSEVSKDMYKLWKVNPKKCLQLAVYIRLITRETQIVLPNETITLDVQRGQGLKHEGIMRMLWLAIYHRQTFMANIPYFIAAGSWKDIFEMLSLDLQYHGWEGRKLDWNFMRKTILAGLTNPDTSELVKKYLPTIRSIKDCKTIESQANTMLGQYLATCLYGTSKKSEDSRTAQRRYRLMKSSGTAHKWQQLISQKNLLELDFNTIHGRALSLLVGSKFLKNQGLLEKYQKWIMSKPVAKYTGYVFELFKPLGNDYQAESIPEYQEITINKQFDGLVEVGRKNLVQENKLLVVRDVSASMTSCGKGTSISSYAIAKAMSLYFSALLEGPFKDAYAIFSKTCQLNTWKGKTAVDKWRNETKPFFGTTDFMSVAKLFTDIKKTVPENEFPTGILCISDGDFAYCKPNKTNFEAFREELLNGGFSKGYVDNFKLILWDIPNDYYGTSIRPKFESYADAPNNFYISGYDPASIAFIMGTKSCNSIPKNAIELFNAAMNQDLLNRLVVVEQKIAKKD